MIRPATSDDIPVLVALGRLMHAESPVFSRLSFDAGRLAETIANVIQSETGFARVYVEGAEVAGGMLASLLPHWFSRDLVACDLALFIAPARRGGMASVRLLDQYVAWARSKGAAIVQLGISTGIAPEKTEALCRRLGGWRTGVTMEF